jgi:hypothetical protein
VLINQNNRTRSFGEIITLEAWHDKFDDTNQKVSLHADVVFREGRLGGDPTSEVKFRLSVKQAELVIILPELEPVKVDPSSVLRDDSDLTIHRTLNKNTETNAGASADIKMISTAKEKISADVSVSGGQKISETEVVEAVEVLKKMRVVQSKTADGHYRWELSPAGNTILEGRPWNPNDHPRLKLVDLRSDRSKGIAPAIMLEVRCLREDLRITNIELKDNNLFRKLKEGKAFQNKLIAAQAYIRQRLINEGLNFGDLSDSYAPVVLARIQAASNGDDI